jgi:hypothetical protein
MKRNDIISIMEAAGPFTRNGLFASDSPTFGKHISFERPRKFILSALKREVKPAFEYKDPDHTGYRFSGCHLEIERVCEELGISEYVRASTGIYETIISFKGLSDNN